MMRPQPSEPIMTLDERFGELRELMHSRHGEDRWQAACAMVQDWPQARHLEETVIPYLRGWFARDDTIRLAPDAWWTWSASDTLIPQHPALSLATGITWRVSKGRRVEAQRHALHSAGLTCHKLYWRSSWQAARHLLNLPDAPLTGLIALNLRDRQLDDEGAHALAQSSHLSRLSALLITHNQIGCEGATALAQSPSLAKLNTLDLNQNQLCDAGALALARSPQLHSLTSLHLSRNWLGDAGAIALASAAHLSQLTSLHLSHNEIGDAGAIALAQSPHLSNLMGLRLNINHIGDAGMMALAQSPHLSNLTELHLGRNMISDLGAQALASSPYLSEAIRAQWRSKK